MDVVNDVICSLKSEGSNSSNKILSEPSILIKKC